MPILGVGHIGSKHLSGISSIDQNTSERSVDIDEIATARASSSLPGCYSIAAERIPIRLNGNAAALEGLAVP